MGEKNSSKAKTWIISFIALVVVIVLGASVMGIQYFSIKNSNKELNGKISELENKNKQLESEKVSNQSFLDGVQSQITEFENKLNEQNGVISDLQQENENLKTEVSRLTQMKAKADKNETNQALAYYKSLNTGPKVCYLTFDDGPSDNTLKILNILKTGNAKATFFVMGTKKMEHLNNIKNDGHAIGLHTDTHEWTLYKTEETYFADLYAIRDKVQSITGLSPNIIRFPGGSSNAISRRYNHGIMTRLTQSVAEQGFYFFDWNVDSGDAAGGKISVNTLLNNIKKQSKNKTEICILMHDTDSKNTTVQALPYIISYLRSEGFRFEVLSGETNGFHHENRYN